MTWTGTQDLGGFCCLTPVKKDKNGMAIVLKSQMSCQEKGRENETAVPSQRKEGGGRDRGTEARWEAGSRLECRWGSH